MDEIVETIVLWFEERRQRNNKTWHGKRQYEGVATKKALCKI